MKVPHKQLSEADQTIMLSQVTTRRLAVVGRILSTPKPYLYATAGALETIRLSSNKSQVTIGDISKTVQETTHPEYIPIKYLKAKQSQQKLKHLRWMLQKDLLGQDMFLMGRPGPGRRRLALEYLQLTGRELEFVALSRDTTEADLKQRREIEGGSVKYFDQSAVRAAVEGRVLVLEGVEKAERNVLPVLNNLLENREMHLEDGRFLIPASRYDKLLKDHSQEELDRWRLVRVSEDFRVIALGLPVPKYSGNPLDPPLRSRFQARFVDIDSYKDALETLRELAPRAAPERLARLLSCCYALLSTEAAALSVPDFPTGSLAAIARVMEEFPSEAPHSLLTRAFPYRSMLGPEAARAVLELLAAFDVAEPERSADPVLRVASVQPDSSGSATVTINRDHHTDHVKVPRGSGDGGSPAPKFVETGYQESLLAQLLQSHVAGDMCIIGPRGCGKSATVRQLAAMLNYTIEPIVLYQDMSSRDLVQQRSTLPNGDTVWNDAPLVTAALDGHLAVLDGLHRVHPGTLAVVHRLAQDRELQLHDGRRLLRDDRYEELKSKLKWTDEQLKASGIQKIHPSFRIIALSEPPSSGKGSTQWLTPEMLSLFLFHEMRPLSSEEELAIVTDLIGEPTTSFRNVVEIAQNLRESDDPTLRAIASSLSTRQLLRISRRMAFFSTDDACNAVHRASLSRFLPHIARQALDKALADMTPQKQPAPKPSSSVKQCRVDGDSVQIGDTFVKRHPDTSAKSKVPDILFYDVPQHVALLEVLAQDFLLGEHLLLVGNQGVGKNKVADRLLQLLNRPREYIQLHRDTTVQTLTLQPTVRDGIVVYDDSPLVTAVKLGHVLVVDEADKAPTHVTCILKTLVESGEMILSDGRRIVPNDDVRALNPSPKIIPIHPGFRMIVLANRPGFPFLGNDFFGSLGDLFSCHAVDNPSPESERALLKSYGPDVPDELIQKLVRAFGELRSMADQGLVSYPYSTREVVNIVKHLQAFPDEGLTSVVSNVFDFDQHSKETLDTLTSVLRKHGIPIGARPNNVSFATELPLPPLQKIGVWHSRSNPVSLDIEERFVKPKKPVNLHYESFTMDRVEARSTAFSEMLNYWNIPLSEMSIISSLAVTKGVNFSEDVVHVATMNPLSLFSMSPFKDSATVMSLQGLLESSRYSRSRVTIAPLSHSQAGSILVHEETTNSLALVDTHNKTAMALPMISLLDQASETFSRNFGGKETLSWCMVPLQDSNSVILYERDGCKVEFLDTDQMKVFSISVPFKIRSLCPTEPGTWLLHGPNERLWALRKVASNDPCPSVLRQLSDNEDTTSEFGDILASNSDGLGSAALSQALDQKISAPNRLIATSNTLAAVVVGFPELDSSDNEVYAWRRENSLSRSKPLVMTEIGQIIRPVKTHQVPSVAVNENEKTSAGYLEVIDVLNHTMRYIHVPEPHANNPSAAYLYSNSDRPLLVEERSNSGLVTVDAGGCVRLWETGLAQLQRSLDDWQKLIGIDRGDLDLTIETDSGKDVSNPKHGKVDPKNDPHVGGNTWAGGTGGRDTAGLGGKGGPYRLDAGHKVHQLSDAEKDAVPEHVKRAAREMGQRAFQQRLKEIQMSPYDAKLYDQFYQGVSKQIQSLRVVLSSLQAKSKERQWMRHQTTGELDDTKIIEGLTGEKTIYRRRAEADPEAGSPQLKPKRLRLVVDVSGSMYRFNGYDGRLDREMEAMVLVMEAFQGFEDKILYDIHGHSGEGHGIVFVDSTKSPSDNKKRLDVIKLMHAHAQFCISGDHTLSATRSAISSLAEEDCDDAIVVVLSDANLERYGISPKRFAAALTDEAKVCAYAIFIGSLGDQAVRLTKQLPAGRAFVCMDLKNLPQILHQIFTASMLSSA